jgi:phage shock protein E
MRIFAPALVVVALLGCASAPAPNLPAASSSPTPSDRIDGATAHELVRNGATLVDVRSAAEFASRHIEGAVNVPVDDVTTHDFGGKDKPLVLYCMHGQRSGQAAKVLRDAGYTRVYLLGAMSAWDQ